MEEIEHTMPIEQLLEKLGVSKVTAGISDQILMQRLEQDGYNLLPKEKLRATALVVFQENLTFFLYCCIFTSILSTLLEIGPSSSLSHITIIAFTFVGHMISMFTSEKLKIPEVGSLIAVIRNGKSNILDSKFLVRGDIIEIEQTMIAPADIRLIKASNLTVNGSILLGKEGIHMGDTIGGGDYLESTNMIFQGSTIETGKGIGIVLQTGPRTILAKNLNRVSTLSSFELKWVIFVGLLWISGFLWQKYYRKEVCYNGFLLLCLVLTKFPHFIAKGKNLCLLTITHLMIRNQVFPKTIVSYEILKQINYMMFDIRDVLVSDAKEVKKLYISDALTETFRLKNEGDFEKLLQLTYYATYKEKKEEVVKGPVSMDEYDPTPPEQEYNHPIESTLRNFIEVYKIQEKEHTIHAKIGLSSKNSNSLTVITPKGGNPLAILLGEAVNILKSSKFMHVSGNYNELPIRTLSHMCDELTLDGNICIGVSFSEIDPEILKKNQELTPDTFEFSLCGIYIIKEHTQDSRLVLPLAEELGITLIGIGKESKEYILNTSYASNLITSPPKEYKGQTLKKWDTVIFSPIQVAKDYKLMENTFSFIPGLAVFDAAYIINQMKADKICYVGQNHVALKVSDIGISLIGSSKDIKESSNFVLLSNTPLFDLLKCIKELKNFGSYDRFFIQENAGCLIPCISYFIVVMFIKGEMSSLGILLIDFAIPLSNQFL